MTSPPESAAAGGVTQTGDRSVRFRHGIDPTRVRRKAPYSDEAVQLLRDYMCPYCKTSTLEGKGAGRGRKQCTECGSSFGIPRRRASRVTPGG